MYLNLDDSEYGQHVYRIISKERFLDWGDQLPTEDIYSYVINPHELITQVMIDPRVSYDEFQVIKKDIRQKTGYSGEIKRSLLYRLPDTLIIEVKQNIQDKALGHSKATQVFDAL